MAPAKKKKKAAANPARGFATTSVASKPKPEKEAKPEPAKEPEPEAEKLDYKPLAGGPTADTKEINELTPEELEKRLEEGELQAFVDRYAEKCKRDAARQISRLRTERRLLRGSADDLGIGKILSPEFVTEILQIAQNEMDGGSFSIDDSTTSAGSKSQHDLSDAFLSKLWSLKLCLEGIEVPQDRLNDALTFVIRKSWAGMDVSAAKESIWGLDDAIDYIALKSDASELRNYDDVNSAQKLKVSALKTEADVAVVVDTPVQSDSEKSAPKVQQAAVLSPAPSVLGSDHADSNQSDNTDDGESQESDLGSDLEPDDLLAEYLKAKEKLYVRYPGSDKFLRSKKPPKNPSSSTKPKSRKIVALEAKMTKIESDMLFDKYIADERWLPIRETLDDNKVSRPRPRRRRKPVHETLHPLMNDMSLDEVDDKPEPSPKEVKETNGQSPAQPLTDPEDDLGPLFGDLPQAEVDPVTGQTQITIDNGAGGKVKIRDFGKWTGVTPRKALEDVLKARDTGFRLAYTVISSTAFSTRSSLTISYTKPQEWDHSIQIPTISVSEQGDRRITYSMVDIATPDKTQADAYVSTSALFLISHASPRDEKVYLRLPTAWKEFWSELQEIKKEFVNGEDRASLSKVKKLLDELVEKDDDEGVVVSGAFDRRRGRGVEVQKHEEESEVAEAAPKSADQRLVVQWEHKSSSPSYQHMLGGRMGLPVWNFKDQILSAIDSHQVIIICGETGCGKSTQVPAYLLEHSLSRGKPCKIYCTEPRRISAISLAKRVSEELGERKQDLGTTRSMVGYTIRLESNMTKETRLVYATTGIVMRMLESSTGLEQITHLVLDEVHERSIESDFLLIVLRRLLHQRPDLKVVLMSATVDAVKFSTYLNNAPVLTVPGRTFPVAVKYLEDAVELTDYNYDLEESDIRAESIEADDWEQHQEANSDIAKTLQNYSARTKKTISKFDEYKISYKLILNLLEYIASNDRYIQYSNAVLVFLPGIAEIRELYDLLSSHQTFGNPQHGGWYIYALHSSVASEDQSRVFDVPPEGIRKIVLATNIAETGITIPDITCVIDCGKHKEMRFDERRQLSRLIESFISKANAKQRRGRAGRVQEGLCFHLFTKYRHDNMMVEQQTPEMLRLSLQDLVLRVKICKLGGIEETLSEALDAPLPKNVRRSIDALIEVKALTGAEALTPLGRQLAKLPLDVHLGKLILFGSIFKCLDVCLTIAALISSKSPFVAPWEKRAQANMAKFTFKRGDSDLLTLWEAYSAWRRVCTTVGSSEYTFCRKNFLSPQNLSNIEDLKLQLVTAVVEAGFLKLQDQDRQLLNRARSSSNRKTFFAVPAAWDINTQNDLIVNSVIAWSFYPHLLTREGKGWRNLANNQQVSLHPTSVNKNGPAKYLSYYHILQSSNKFYNAHETSAVEDFAIALMCGDVEFRMYTGTVTLDSSRARFSVREWKLLLALRILRTRLKSILNLSLQNPNAALNQKQERYLEMWKIGFDKVYAAMKARAGAVV